MCHWIFLLPLIGLPVFWLLPPGPATTLYLFILLLSAVVYWFVVRAMRRPPEAGAEELIGTRAEVVSRLGPLDTADYLVRRRGELWSARSPESLKPGEGVKVVALKGIQLVVTRQMGGIDERHYH